MPLSLEDVVPPVGPRVPAQGEAAAFRRRARAALSFGTLATALLVAAGCATTGSHGPDPGLGGARETRVRLPPFVWWTRSADGASEARNFLGFLYGQRAESAEPVPSSPDDFVVSRNSLRILWPFYYRDSLVRADGIRTETRSLLPFVWTKHKSESSGRGADYFQRRVVVPPLLFSLRSDNTAYPTHGIAFVRPK